MAQNLVDLFGEPGAARFLELLSSPFRLPAWELLALNEDGTTRLDVSAYVKSWSSPEMNDSSGEIASASASYAVANPEACFDRYTGGANSDVFRRGRILRFRKGLRDPLDGSIYLLPAFWGRIISVTGMYQSSGDPALQVVVADALKDAVKVTFTSDDYQNTETNRIAADLLRRYGGFSDARIHLASVSHLYTDVQFPDFKLSDAVQSLYDPLLYAVRADETGGISTRPRLGSGLSQLAGILGYPDQTEEPPEDAVDYVIPDSIGVETIEQTEQDYDGVYNQAKVLGEPGDSITTLGPLQVLYTLADSSVDAQGKLLQQYGYSDNPSSSTNAVLAKSVYVEFRYSTTHNLDTSPQTQILSLMTWRGAWSSTTSYAIGDAVSYAGTTYACQADGTGSASVPGTDTVAWTAMPVSGPFVPSFQVMNGDPHLVGQVTLEAVSDTYLVIRIEGRQYSSGSIAVRHHGGFDFNFSIHGQPVSSQGRTLTAYADYNAEAVSAEALSDLFGDHQTYQAAHQPFAMSGAVIVYKDGVNLGTVTADQTNLSGETAFSVDYQRGRIVLKDLSYIDWSADSSTSHPFSSGGTAQSTAQAFNLSLLQVPAPAAIFATFREGECVYTFAGLTAGQGYNLRLHFADPANTLPKRRVFSVYVQGVKTLEGMDIVAKAGGAYYAWQEEITGIAPDADGNIIVRVTQHDPYGGELLPECSSNGTTTGSAIGLPLISGIEVLLPQGQGASPYAVNAGGPAYGPSGTGANYVAAPVITADYKYSPIQATYGIQTVTINNPFIDSQAGCQTVAGYWVNYSQWKCHRHKIRTASMPHVQPGDLIRWYNPKTNVDFWGYLPTVSRTMAAPDASGNGGADSDTYTAHLIYARTRT